MSEWEEAYDGWGIEFYRRLAAARGFNLAPEALERRALAFGAAMGAQMRYAKGRVLDASDRPPGLTTSSVDRLLAERADGEAQ